MDTSTPTPVTGPLIAELLDWFGWLEQVVAHMRASSSPPPTNQQIGETLTSLLADTLAPVADRHAAAALVTTTEVLNGITETAADNIFCVPHPNRADRRARRRRGEHR